MSNPEATFDFHTLMPELLVNAIESKGIRIDSGLTPLNSYENRVYQFLDEERKRYVVKFYRPQRWSADQIQEEHDFSLELHQQEIPVVAPLMIEGETLHHYHGFMFALFPSVGGRQFEVDNDEQLESVGRYLARIHQVGQSQRFKYRPTVEFMPQVLNSKERLLTSPLLSNKLQLSFLHSLENLIENIASRWSTRWRATRLHGDCHSGNILWRDGPCFVDLDDACNGPVIQDLWMLLYGDRQQQIMQLDFLLEAYCEFNEFDMGQVALIEPLRAIRMINYLAWLVSRWNDPAFPKAFPWLEDESFWAAQITAFNEQADRVQQPPLLPVAMY